MDNSQILLDTSFLAQPSCLYGVREQVKEALVTLGLPSKQWQALVLAVDEACSNIIRHTYHFESNRAIDLKILKMDDTLVFRLHDDGISVDEKMMSPGEWDQTKPGGLGLHFIHEIMDKTAIIDTNAQGNTLEMVKNLRLSN